MAMMRPDCDEAILYILALARLIEWDSEIYSFVSYAQLDAGQVV